MFSGLANLKKELIAAVADTKLSKPRRELGLLLLDEIDQSQLPGYSPSGLPEGYPIADIYDTVPQKTQYDLVTFVALQNRWINDPNRPKAAWEFIQPKTQSTHPTPTPVDEEFD